MNRGACIAELRLILALFNPLYRRFHFQLCFYNCNASRERPLVTSFNDSDIGENAQYVLKDQVCPVVAFPLKDQALKDFTQKLSDTDH
jgi:hypothetical protein